MFAQIATELAKDKVRRFNAAVKQQAAADQPTDFASAYKAGLKLAQEQMVVGKVFLGSMQIADKVNSERCSDLWSAAIHGAATAIGEYSEIITNDRGVITSLTLDPRR